MSQVAQRCMLACDGGVRDLVPWQLRKSTGQSVGARVCACVRAHMCARMRLSTEQRSQKYSSPVGIAVPLLPLTAVMTMSP